MDPIREDYQIYLEDQRLEREGRQRSREEQAQVDLWHAFYRAGEAIGYRRALEIVSEYAGAAYIDAMREALQDAEAAALRKLPAI